MRRKKTFQQFIDLLRGKRRYGPLYPDHYQLTLDLCNVRNRVRGESDPLVRSFLNYSLSFGKISSSQILQDAFVQWVLKEKKNGFFCEFGATNGVSLSNSYSLEHHFAWTGICAEPGITWHADLRRNRPGAIIETRCVWSSSGEKLTFSETSDRELSGLSQFNKSKFFTPARRRAKTYLVETISLNDLLKIHNAPNDLDYLSIDTEGSELNILKAFDMNLFQPKVITVEHNFKSNRQSIYKLLTDFGYRRVLPEISVFDDWYIATGIELPMA